ncbi:hypothetical protein BVC80_1837g331 [Macleaya cordata]|uniref:Uncharacterized protein n=1 Tax=Macleaya cordata TaxID=56857 RepID=A0A200R485_MACCD|nr:hypothetical protein BVC80_1837g331 [Macleaya cordata]
MAGSSLDGKNENPSWRKYKEGRKENLLEICSSFLKRVKIYCGYKHFDTVYQLKYRPLV